MQSGFLQIGVADLNWIRQRLCIQNFNDNINVLIAQKAKEEMTRSESLGNHIGQEVGRAKPEGERWLELMGYGHLKGQPTGYIKDGIPVLAEEFTKLCGDYARPLFIGLESLDINDPRYVPAVEMVRKKFKQYFGTLV